MAKDNRAEVDQPATPVERVSRRLRVSLISHAYSEEAYRAKLRLMSKTIDLEVVAPESFPFPYGTLHFTQRGVQGYQTRTFKPLFPLRIKSSTRWFLQCWDLGFRRFQPDIVHVENEVHSFILLQAIVCRALFAPKARIIVFVWANVAPAGPKGFVLSFLARVLRPAIDFYLAGNSEGASLLARSGVGMERVWVVPQSGVEQDVYRPVSASDRDFQRRHLGITRTEFVIGYVGRLVKAKGIDDLIAAYERLIGSLCGVQLRVLLVGDGPEKARLSRLGRHVIVVSPGGALATAVYYSAMDVLVLPSRTQVTWKEQFGRVLIEAMSSALPVIGSQSGAIPEVVGDAGLTFPEGDVMQLAAHLASLIYHPLLRAGLGEKGRQRVLKNYTAEIIAQRTTDAYAIVQNCA